MVSRAVLAACVGKDGGAPGDRFLTDPGRCHFNPATLPVCKTDASSDDCLTPTQLGTLRRLRSGPVNPRIGERIFAGLVTGSEDQPLGPAMQGDTATWPDQQFYPFRWALGAGFDAAQFDFDHDLDRVDAELAGTLNANSADLSGFARHGGKLMIYTGLSDPAVPFTEVVQYYERVGASSGGAATAAEFARLFLVPGMGHCFGGPGATDISQPFVSDVPPTVESDALMTLVAWTERGAAPTRLIARKAAGDGQPAQQRPVCVFPALPAYRGGDTMKPESFVCTGRSVEIDQSPAPRYLN